MRFLVLALVGAVFLTGCESMRSASQNVREKFTGPTYQTRVVKADQRKTYEAARAALTNIGFTLTRGGPNQGKIEALNRISGGGPVTGVSQMSLDLKLTPVPDGTEVALLFSEIREDDFTRRPGSASATPLRDSLLYESYFQHIEAALQATGAN